MALSRYHGSLFDTALASIAAMRAALGITNIDNTSDADKPVSTAQQSALNGKAPNVHNHSAADINSGTLNAARLPNGGVTNERMAALPANSLKGNNTSAEAVAKDLTVGEARSLLSVNQVDNTSDVNKPVSTAQQTALDTKAPWQRTISAGTGLVGGGDFSDNRSIAIDKAEVAAVRSAAANKVLTADLIESASAAVALSDATTVALNWDAGINFTLQISANRVLGNPTNGQPGTWRTVIVTGNDATDRTLTFGAQFGGALPSLTDIDSTKAYLLMIFCVSPTHFLAAAINASAP